MADALGGFARATRRYIGVNTVFGLLTGLVDMVALWWLGRRGSGGADGVRR